MRVGAAQGCERVCQRGRRRRRCDTVDIRGGVLGDDVGVGATEDDAGVDGEAAAEIGEAGDRLEQARKQRMAEWPRLKSTPLWAATPVTSMR